MKLLFIRHGQPNYTLDTLTRTGTKQARMLAKYFRETRTKIDYIYTSPLGRAKKTAHYTARKLKIEPVVLDWLHEFSAKVDFKDAETGSPSDITLAYNDLKQIFPGHKGHVPWDMLTSFLNNNPDYLESFTWKDVEMMNHSDILSQYDQVTAEFDQLLANHGYTRDNNYYSTEQGNHDTIAIFSHFGIGTVLFAHLLNISPFSLWHGTCSTPSSITEFVTEEREKGVVNFRLIQLGATPHLDYNFMERDFRGRFCECYEDEDCH